MKRTPDAVKGSPGGWRSLHTDSQGKEGGFPFLRSAYILRYPM